MQIPLSSSQFSSPPSPPWSRLNCLISTFCQRLTSWRIMANLVSSLSPSLTLSPLSPSLSLSLTHTHTHTHTLSLSLSLSFSFSLSLSLIHTQRVLFCSFTAFGLDYYTEVLDLRYLLEHLSEEPFFRKHRKLNEALVTVIEDYSLVSFLPLTVQVLHYHAKHIHYSSISLHQIIHIEKDLFGIIQ